MGNKKDSGKGPLGQGYEDFRLQEETASCSGDRSKSVRSCLPSYQEYGHKSAATNARRPSHKSKLHQEVTALVDYISSRGLSSGEATVVLLQAGFQMGGGVSADAERMPGGFHGYGRRDN